MVIWCLPKNDSISSEEIHTLETIKIYKQKHEHFSSLVETNKYNTTYAKDVGDLFTSFPGFSVAKRGAFALEPVLRSYRQNQLNIFIDGLAKSDNACPNRMDPITVHLSPDQVSKIEVIKGPYSVRFGPSLGGIINLMTQNPEVSGSKPYHATFSTGYEANGSGKYLRSSINGKSSSLGWLLAGGFKDFGNYSSGDGKLVPSQFQAYDYTGKVDLKPHQNHHLKLSWRQTFARDVYHAGLPMDLKSDDNTILTIDHRTDNIAGENTSLTTKLYGAYVDHTMWNKGRPNETAVKAIADVQSREAGARSELAIFIKEKTTLQTGINYRFLNKDGKRQREVKRNVCTNTSLTPSMNFSDLIWQDSWMQTAGAYIEASQKPHPKLSFRTGIRADFSLSDINDPAPDFSALYPETELFSIHTDYSITALGQWLPQKSFGIQWAFGKGTRAPSLLERYINHFTVGMDAHEYVGNPRLKPETNYQTDLSLSFIHPSIQLRGDVFYAFIENYISGKLDTTLSRKYMPCKSPVFSKRFVNVHTVKQMGFETSLNLKLPFKFSFQSQLSYTYAENQSWNEPLAEVPPLTNISRLSYQSPKFHSTFEFEWADDQNRVSKSFGESKTNSYQVLHLRFTYRPFSLLMFRAGVNNLLDESYTQHLSRAYKNSPDAGLAFYEPGRSFFLGIEVKTK